MDLLCQRNVVNVGQNDSIYHTQNVDAYVHSMCMPVIFSHAGFQCRFSCTIIAPCYLCKDHIYNICRGGDTSFYKYYDEFPISRNFSIFSLLFQLEKHYYPIRVAYQTSLNYLKRLSKTIKTTTNSVEKLLCTKYRADVNIN